ncbi:hypothetical protein NL321_30215, partial [Klebsiella pneumoniae]|nr:hypothetical protein [Klebsiella pneumoniae]
GWSWSSSSVEWWCSVVLVGAWCEVLGSVVIVPVVHHPHHEPHHHYAAEGGDGGGHDAACGEAGTTCPQVSGHDEQH